MAGMIENEAAYEAAVRRRILANARKTQPQKLVEFTETYPEVVRFLNEGAFGRGEFAELLEGFRSQLDDFGRLSPRQVAVVERAIERRQAAQARFAEKAAEDAKVSRHVGRVGDRCSFTVTVERVIVVDGYYGTMHVNILRDEQGNVLVYRGNRWNQGETLTVKARVKEHGEFRGVKQTILSRPTLAG